MDATENPLGNKHLFAPIRLLQARITSVVVA